MSVACPASIVMDTVLGESYALVTLPDFTSVSDNVGVVDTWIIINGSQYEVGDQVQFEYVGSPHILVYHAVDAAFNEATCSVTVTVSGQ